MTFAQTMTWTVILAVGIIVLHAIPALLLG